MVYRHACCRSSQVMVGCRAVVLPAGTPDLDHQVGCQVFESRWAMSYLRGPLSRSQIKLLTDPTRDASAIAVTAATISSRPSPVRAPALPAPVASARPVLPPQVIQFFVPVRVPPPPGGAVLYQPRLLGEAQVRYADAKLKVELLQDIMVMTEITDSAVPVDWAAAEELAITVKEPEKNQTEADYAPCAPAASQVKNYSIWARDLTNSIQNNRKIELLRSASLNQSSKPGESDRDFRVRLQQVSREARDATAEKLRAKYAPKMDIVISLGSTLLGAFLGRKTVSLGTLGKAGTTMRSASRATGQAGDVERAQETVEAVQEQLHDVEAQFQAEVDAAMNACDPATETLEKVELRPARSDINVRLVALVWLPFSRDPDGALNPAY